MIEQDVITEQKNPGVILTPTGVFPDQIYIDPPKENFRTTTETLQQVLETPVIPELSEHQRRLTVCIHMISSLFHISGENVKPKEGVSSDGFSIPPSTLILEKEIKTLLSQELAHISTIKQDRIIERTKRLRDICTIQQNGPNTIVAGDYFPFVFESQTKKEGESLPTHLLVPLMMLKLHRELEENKHKGSRLIVCHPDLPFFLGQGRMSAMAQGAKELNKIAETLGMHILFENVAFANHDYQRNLKWAESPLEIYENIVGDFGNLGICVDIKHMLQRGFTTEEILSQIRQLNNQTTLALHTWTDKWRYINGTDPRRHNELQDPLTSENPLSRPILELATQLGIPVIQEHQRN